MCKFKSCSGHKTDFYVFTRFCAFPSGFFLPSALCFFYERETPSEILLRIMQYGSAARREILPQMRALFRVRPLPRVRPNGRAFRFCPRLPALRLRDGRIKQRRREFRERCTTEQKKRRSAAGMDLHCNPRAFGSGTRNTVSIFVPITAPHLCKPNAASPDFRHASLIFSRRCAAPGPKFRSEFRTVSYAAILRHLRPSAHSVLYRR